MWRKSNDSTFLAPETGPYGPVATGTGRRPCASLKITGHRTEHVFRQYAVGEDVDVRKALGTVLAAVGV